MDSIWKSVYKPPKTTKTKGKSFCKNSKKQGRDENMQEDYPTVLLNNGGKERQEGYLIHLVYMRNDAAEARSSPGLFCHCSVVG